MSMTTPINRRPEGTPAGGQFAPVNRPEASDISLADPADRPINLEPGEDETYPELAEGDVIDRLEVSRDEDDPDTYTVSASRAVNFHHLVEHEQPDLTEEEREAWLQRHSAVIDDFMGERYGAEMSGDDWSSIDAEFSTKLTGGTPTEGAVGNAAWEDTNIVNLANEEDPGTFGTENLSRLLHERVEDTASFPDFWNTRRDMESMTQGAVDNTVQDRYGKRELPDAVALSVAYDMGMSGPYPTMAKLARTGFADREEVRNDLRKIYERDQGKPLATAKADMMFTWLEHGGDNS